MQSTGFSAVQMDDFKLDTTSNLTLKIGNRKGRTINITAIEAIYGTGAGSKRTANGYCRDCSIPACLNQNLGPNKVCQETMGVWTAQAKGSAYNIEIRVNYTDIKTGVAHTDYGTISGAVEPA